MYSSSLCVYSRIRKRFSPFPKGAVGGRESARRGVGLALVGRRRPRTVLVRGRRPRLGRFAHAQRTLRQGARHKHARRFSKGSFVSNLPLRAFKAATSREPLVKEKPRACVVWERLLRARARARAVCEERGFGGRRGSLTATRSAVRSATRGGTDASARRRRTQDPDNRTPERGESGSVDF